MCRKTISVLFIVFLPALTFSQVDNEFWFAPPMAQAAYYDIGDEADIEFTITAFQATSVTISKPATGWSYTIPLIGEMSSVSKSLKDIGLSMSDVVTPPYPLPDASNPAFKNGFLIKSEPGEISVSYKLKSNASQDQVSLKGENALGTEFYVSTQNSWPNRNEPSDKVDFRNGFTIVATQDSTTIDIYQNNDWSVFPAGGPYPIKRTLLLNAGETYSIQSINETAASHIMGVYVESNKDIAITYWDDQVVKYLSTGGKKYDYASDQIVPTSIIGTDYLVMKGGLDLSGIDGGEKVYITATEDNDTINVVAFDGTILNTFYLNAGESVSCEVTEESTYIHSINPIYVNHYSSINGGKTVSAALLPPIGPCTGSHDVMITRSDDPSDGLILNILAVNDTNPASSYYNLAAEGFTITTSLGNYPIPSSYFSYSSDNTYITLNKADFQSDYLSGKNPIIAPGQTALISNRNAKFHLGVIEGQKNQGAKYGYFSDYGGESARAGVGGAQEDYREYICGLNPIRLVARGGKTYLWEVIGDSANSLDYLSSLTIAAPIYYPGNYGVQDFEVEMTQQCGGDTTVILRVITVEQPLAYFDVESEYVCSPDSILITHGVTMPNITLKWYFNSTTLGRTDKSDVVPSFYQTLPTNSSDTITSYNIELRTTNQNVCPSTYSRTITIKPEINSEFDFIGDSIGCHPLRANLKNQSSGNVDSSSYFWDFGDFNISYELDSVEHTFNNYSLSDTTYEIKLVTRSPFDCMDTSTAQVIVYPRVKALFSTSPNQGCSPLTIDINPVNSFGADSLLWNINYYYDDSSFVYTNKNAFNITHNDISVSSGTDTLVVSLTAKNRYNCADTAIPHNILVFPAATADFSISDDDICADDTISFENNSNGYNLDFYWNLGDGTAPNDSVPTNKPYFNPSGADISYLISLTTISEHNCMDYKDTSLTVHPYLNANFGINYVKNCSPLKVNITNNSYGAKFFDWDMGDGNTYTYANNFTYTYLNPSENNDTTYTVKLVVKNNQECKDSISRILSVKPKVVAVMDLTDKVGCSPLTTAFNNNSTGGSYYIWELGGANIRTDTTEVNFNQVYSNETANDIFYPIKLTARNDAGCDSAVYDTVNVLASILAGFTFNKDSSCSPFTPVITNRSSSGAKVYEWYENGARISSVKNPVIISKTNTGDAPDYYNYTLITYGANDSLHKVCADTNTTSLAIFPELQASFTPDKMASCQPLNTLITNNSFPADSVEYIWYLDNYIYSDQMDPGNLFINNFTNNDQTHLFKLTGKTVHSCKDTVSVNVEVYAYIDANFIIDRPSICSGESFNINRSNTRGKIDNYYWNLAGVSDSRTDVQFSYSFDNLGSTPVNKIISLTVSNANCDSSWTDSITVYPLVTAGFDIPVAQECNPHNATFINKSENADYYNWSLGDGVSSNDSVPVHTYQNFDPVNDATFNVQLIAESQYKCSDTTTGTITVWAKPNANFFLPKSVSCPPFDFSVINSSEGNNPSYFWNLGNTLTSTDFEPTAVLDNSTSTPTYEPIKLLVTSKNGCVDSISRNITIYPYVDVDFTATPLAGCSPLTVNFLGDTTNVQQMVWYIDDQLFSTQISPLNIFLNETDNNIEHDVKIIAYSRYNCIDSSENVITVYPTPSSDFIAGPTPAQYDTSNDHTIINFTNLSKYQSAWDYTWKYGDGNSDKNGQPAFDYTYGNEFWGKIDDNHKIPVTLIAYNKDNPVCKDTITREILILPPIPLVEIGKNISGCVPLTVDFNSYAKYNYDDSYEWNFGDGTLSDSDINPTHTFSRPGTYTVKLNVMGDGGPAADYKIITVYAQPVADFSFNDTIVMIASLTDEADIVNFYNQSQDALGFEWYFDSKDFFNGAEPNSVEKDPTWAYDEVGTYHPVLVAYSTEGCVDTLVHPIPILVQGEGVIEFPSGFFINPEMPASDEYNTDQGAGNLYLFYPKNSGIAEYRLEVYNRWGTLIFETDDVNHGWNGLIRGIPAKQDVYVWRARGRFTNGKPFDISGDVTLIHAPVNIKQ